jgi:hypothetical protein
MPPRSLSAREQVALAQRHLEKVRDAWVEPDWSDLMMYGLYSIEAAVMAAARHLGRPLPKKTHWDKVSLAEWLRDEHGLPDVADLLGELNAGRKAQRICLKISTPNRSPATSTNSWRP